MQRSAPLAHLNFDDQTRWTTTSSTTTSFWPPRGTPPLPVASRRQAASGKRRVAPTGRAVKVPQGWEESFQFQGDRPSARELPLQTCGHPGRLFQRVPFSPAASPLPASSFSMFPRSEWTPRTDTLSLLLLERADSLEWPICKSIWIFHCVCVALAVQHQLHVLWPLWSCVSGAQWPVASQGLWRWEEQRRTETNITRCAIVCDCERFVTPSKWRLGRLLVKSSWWPASGARR